MPRGIVAWWMFAALEACAPARVQQAPPSDPAPAPTSNGPAGTVPPLDPERRNELDRLEDIYRVKLDSARSVFHEADAAFMVGMIHHHAQALVMSRHALRNDAGPTIRTLAARIINGQQDEIAFMRRWLEDRDLDAPDPLGEQGGEEADVSSARPMPAPGAHRMPGMLSQEQMAELQKAQGMAFDRLFLAYMIEHHEGAVTMVRELLATDGAAQADAVFKLASDIQADQSSEIARMRSMLEGLSGALSP